MLSSPTHELRFVSTPAITSGLDLHPVEEMESNGTGWLADSLHAVDNNIKQLLKLIEDKDIRISNGESETENQKRIDVAPYMDDLRIRYHLLAERYIQLAREMELGENFHDLDENLASPFYTPESKFTEHKHELRSVGSDIRLSDISCKNGFGSSSTSISDSASENSNSELPTNGGFFDGKERVVQNGKEELLIKRIEEYEMELQIANAKVKSSQEEVANFKFKLEGNEVVVKQLKDKIEASHALVNMKDEVIGTERNKVAELEGRILFDADEISKYSEEVQRLKEALADALNAILQKDEHYLSETHSLLEEKKSVENSFIEQKLQMQSLENEISEMKIEIAQAKSSHDAKEASWKTEMESLDAESMAKSNTVDSLSKYADALKHKYDMANAKLETLAAELSHKDNVIHQLNERINHLNSANADLRGNQDAVRQLEVRATQCQIALSQAISESDSLHMCIDELRVKVIELEKELEEQRALVTEGAELKREAIRQLCISLEHYRTEYLELREVVVGKKRRTRTGVGSQEGTSSS